jgi:hypothetical protein
MVFSDAQWYIMNGNEPSEPIGHLELLNRAQSGLLRRTDLVWQDGFPEWVQAGTIKGLFLVPPPPPKCEGFEAILLAKGRPTDRDTGMEPIANRKMIAKLREDATDVQFLAAEMIRVAVRLNPVNVQIYNFLGFVNQVNEYTERHEVARLVQSAMEAVDLANAVSALDEALDTVTKIGPELIKNYSSELVTIWPESRQLVQHRWLDDPVKECESVQEQLRRAVRAHQQDLVAIQNHFRQLQEFHPRYQEIMTRSDFWDYVIGIAAGFFGGGIGVIGAQVWEDWRGKSDSEFDQFTGTTLAFTQKTEQEVESVVSAFLRDLHDFSQSTIAALEGVIEKMDITKIYGKLHYPDPAQKPDEDAKQFFEIVLTNLRGQKISAHSEANIREMLGVH